MNMMKTFFLFLVHLGSTSIFAHFPVSVPVKNDHGIFSAEWSPIQFGIFPGNHFQLFRENTEIYGVAFSPVALYQKSAILSVAPGSMLKSNYFLQVSGFLTATEKNYGISFSPFLNFVGRNYGVQTGLINLESNFGYRSKSDSFRLPGLQIGLINNGGGVQFGLLNHNPQALIVWFPIFNFPWGNFD